MQQDDPTQAIPQQAEPTQAPALVTPDGLDGQWYVIHTRSRQEKALAGALAGMNITHYLPLLEQTRYYGRRKARVAMPLFPGYLFLYGQREDAFKADRTKRVVQVLAAPDQQQIAWELQNIQLALERSAPLEPYPGLRAGVHVEVKAGPFRGVQGIVESWGKRDRLYLQVKTLGRAAVLEIDASLLEVID